MPAMLILLAFPFRRASGVVRPSFTPRRAIVASLPDYVAAAKPVPQEARTAWYKSTAQTYAGIMLWFVFWQDVVSGSPTPGGTLASGVGLALLGLLIAALFCHFLTYLVPGLLGMKTGLPLSVVGTSTYGVAGGRFMPGFLMGVLQFGWLAVNAYFSCYVIALCFGFEMADIARFHPVHGPMTIAFILAAVFVGINGIQYVAKVATFMPLIPVAILLILFVSTVGGLGNFDPATFGEAEAVAEGAAEEGSSPLGPLAVLLFMSTYVVGFFATAGAAGADFGMNNRDGKDVQLGGLAGVVGATFFAGGLAILIVAGAQGAGLITGEFAGQLNPVRLMPAIVGPGAANVMFLLLAVAAFAPACFPAFIAANSFKQMMPNVNPKITVGIGALVAMGLAVSGVAGQAVDVFSVIGASFGPICGAMMADYLLAGRKWAGPRAGFNLAGWISWAAGFVVGAVDLVGLKVEALSFLQVGIPAPPMAALITGFVLYVILAKLGLEGKTLEFPSE